MIFDYRFAYDKQRAIKWRRRRKKKNSIRLAEIRFQVEIFNASKMVWPTIVAKNDELEIEMM